MKLCIFYFSFFLILINNSVSIKDFWGGKWFPGPPKKFDDVPNSSIFLEGELSRKNYQNNLMGVSSESCDDGKTNLTVDWNNSVDSYICLDDNRQKYMPDLSRQPVIQCDHIPAEYHARHECMDTPINYLEDIPTFGSHRPLWPVYGEYQYLPVQRWLHSLEHGGVAFLYHPCANAQEVKKLKNIVKGCLHRHVITPYVKVPPERPLVLVVWGCKLMMSKVDTKIATEFIKSEALRGAEKLEQDGQYSYALIEKANVVTDEQDSILCPNN